MSLLYYACISREPGVVILSEHTSSHPLSSSSSSTAPNPSYASSVILSKLPPNDSKLTYASDAFLFHYIKSSGLTFLVMTSDTAGRKMPFAFLNELQSAFLSQFTRDQISDAPAYGMNSFSKQIAQMMHQFETNPPRDPLQEAQRELDGVKSTMVRNVEAILSRGERLDLLIDKTDNMSAQAKAFRKRTVVLRRQMWFKNVKLMFLIGLTIFLIIYLLLASSCGPLLRCGS
ncbi:synaptobrevin-domain-containing protein [Atractiella rhizophila]|nr:synaptobrevin-domain-containing protein [Atractiella rhizophila]